jgi:hypothetical protein
MTVAFRPIQLGEQRAHLLVESDAYHGAEPVTLAGVGDADSRHDPRQRPGSDPRQR